MMPSRMRRLRLYATLSVGIVLIWIWSRKTAITDAEPWRLSADKVVGGGAVIRPDIPQSELQEPPTHDTSDIEEHRKLADQELPHHDDFDTEPPPTDDLLQSDPAKESQKPAESSESTSASSSSSSSTSTAPTTTSSGPSEASSVPVDEDGVPEREDYGRKEVSIDPKTTTSAIHWSKHPEHYPVSSTIQLPSGTSKPFPRIQREVSKLAANGADEDRLEYVKSAAHHSWQAYRMYAFEQDEITPVSHMSRTSFNGWGATLVDSLDTLWIMGMEKEFEEAVDAVAKIDFKTSVRPEIPLFETVIRYLGGLLGAYDVSGKKYITLLDKAVELGEVLYDAFDTPNRVPTPYYKWRPYNTAQPKRASSRVVLAEIGTLSLEFTRLAQLAGEPKYYDAVARITNLFEEWQNSTRLAGMWPTYFDSSGCGPPEPPTGTTPETQQPVPDSEDIQDYLAGAEELIRDGQPGKIGDEDYTLDGGAGESESEYSEGEHHGNTWKRKRQVREYEDDMPAGTVVQNGGKNGTRRGGDSSGTDKVEHVVENSDRTPSPEHELRTPQTTPDTTTTHTRADDGCTYKGFSSVSETGQEIYTLSGMSDSMYEYLPKEYMLLGGQVDQYRTMYLESAAAAIDNLLYKPMTIDERDILMSGALAISPNRSQPAGQRDYIAKFTPEVAHLACFVGGMFAMGGVIFDEPEHVEIGSKLTDGCVWAYNVTGSGIMPEGALVMMCEDTWGECKWNETAYYEALDPYADSRPRAASDARPSSSVVHHASDEDTRSRQELGEHLSEHADDDSEGEDDSEDGEDINGESLSEHAHDEDNPVHDAMKKRQLEALNDDPVRRPAPPSPGNPPTPVASEEDTHSTHFTSTTHEDYVAMKIRDERLPPGFLHINSRRYILRPEAIESVFYMYRITGDSYWREVGWDMFMAIDKHTHAPFGHSAIDDITREEPRQVDQMESFWLAETLKYFYLLYDDPDRWSLDEWVLNTEAHLFRRPPFEFAEA